MFDQAAVKQKVYKLDCGQQVPSWLQNMSVLLMPVGIWVADEYIMTVEDEVFILRGEHFHMEYHYLNLSAVVMVNLDVTGSFILRFIDGNEVVGHTLFSYK